MAIAHVCLGCGLDLARVRPAREPHYGLRVVGCPRCGRFEARRAQPVSAGWRTARRVASAVLTLALQLFMILLLTTFSMASVQLLTDDPLLSRLMARDDSPELVGTLALCLGTALMTGAWLTVGLGHWPQSRAWLAWTIWLLAWLWIVAWNKSVVSSPAGAVRNHWVEAAVWWWPRTITLAGLMVLSLAGIPFGRLVRRAFADNRRRRWAIRRRRWRAARVAA